MEKQRSETENKRVHRKRRAGRKAEKKNNKSEHVQELTAKQRNPKAFTFNSAVRAERQFRRHQDLDTKKQHIPVVDRTPLEPPPIIVAIVGPPKVGKTTLIRCLIKNFTRQPINNIQGPITIVSGKRKRVTFIECNNDINSMVDLAKVADLVFLLIDGSFGFEMEIFEFLNICQTHGMPKIMGVLTHLDMLKNNKTLKHTKKTLKHRFWTEVYAGAKLFYLSGILHGEYIRSEMQRLGRFISVMKFRPLTWQTTHPYLLADRIEDLTAPETIRENSKCDRVISLYGYVRGIPLKKQSSVHVAGCGDFTISDVCFLPDPCPLPDKLKKRVLIDKERLLYAPFSGVGGIVYDKDAVYIDLGGSHSHNKAKAEREDQELFTSLIDAKSTLYDKIEQSELQLFSNAEPVSGKEFQETFDVGCKTYTFETVVGDDGRKRKKIMFSSDEADNPDEDSDDDNSEEDGSINDNEDSSDDDNEDSSDDDNDDESEETDDFDNRFDSDDSVSEMEEENKMNAESCVKINSNSKEKDNFFEETKESNDVTSLKWKSDLAQRAADAFILRQNSSANLWKLVYGSTYQKQSSPDTEDADEADFAEGLFKRVNKKQNERLEEKDFMNAEDSSKFVVSKIRDWSDETIRDSIKDYFVTGKWTESENADTLLKLDDMNDNLYGDFEDLETGKKYAGDASENNEDNKNNNDGDDKKPTTPEELLGKKRKLKERFDSEYDEKDGGGVYYDALKQEMSKQAELNKTLFEGLDDDVRVQLEGYRPGMYVRIEINDVPCELITEFDPSYPLIVGGLSPKEQNIGYLNVRIKKHRWYSRILKSKNPIVFSLGWRRFQSLPIYSKLEDNLRYRMLKYTPEHVACMAHFWGPMTTAGTGFLALQDVTSAKQEEGFRIVATGTVVDTNQSTEITKKLKLIGEPFKIYRKTAFIKNMFNSALEVAKFEGAQIRTVSGIRGQIKKACTNKQDGSFRATFEDTIKLSDIIFCRTWYTVAVPKLYNPVTNLLLPLNEKYSWSGMKTSGQLKRERGIKYEPQLDSLYTPVVRKPKVFKPLRVPKRLQRQLPYKDRPKTSKIGHKNDPRKERVAVVRDPHEYKVSSMLKMLRTNFKAKQNKEKEEMKKRVLEHKRRVEMEEFAKQKRIQEKRKNLFIKQTKQKQKSM